MLFLFFFPLHIMSHGSLEINFLYAYYCYYFGYYYSILFLDNSKGDEAFWSILSRFLFCPHKAYSLVIGSDITDISCSYCFRRDEIFVKEISLSLPTTKCSMLSNYACNIACNVYFFFGLYLCVVWRSSVSFLLVIGVLYMRRGTGTYKADFTNGFLPSL